MSEELNKSDYEGMQNIYEKFLQRQSLKVEAPGDCGWWLVETPSGIYWVENYSTEEIRLIVQGYQEKLGYVFSQVSVFRKPKE